MNFAPTWLYVKECQHCGLRYFGKTTKKDPHAYIGSGTYWKSHLKKHGVDQPLTLKIKLYTDPKKIELAALKFSAQRDVANSKLWANLRDEDGIGAGGAHSLKTRRRISRTKLATTRIWYTDGIENFLLDSDNELVPYLTKGRIGFTQTEATKEKCRLGQAGIPKSKAHRKALSLASKGKPKSESHRRNNGLARRGRKWFNDGRNEFQLHCDDPKTQELSPGRLPFKWFTDEVKSHLISPKSPRIKREHLQPGRVF